MTNRMQRRVCARRVVTAMLAAAVMSGAVAGAAHASLYDIGVMQLRNFDPTLTGTGVSVAQVEATSYSGPSTYDPAFDADDYAVDPTVNGSVAITYRGKNGTTTTTVYNPATFSAHGTQVAGNFYGMGGVAPGTSAVVNYNENYFFANVMDRNAAIITPLAPVGAVPVSVVNQSFVFLDADASDTLTINQLYDNYVVAHGTIFVSGAGNGGAPQVPSMAYNQISVGAYGGASSVGPTSDGRSKPDITAPEGATSFSTALVSGVATILVQAGNAGRGGTSTSTKAAAVDARTIKALLLTGATKPTGWTHTTTAPLDPNYGAGIVNAYNSYSILAAGLEAASLVNTSETPALVGNVGTAGWNMSTVSSTAANEGVAHYRLDLSGANGPTALTSTLIWWRPQGTVSTDANGFITGVGVTSINNLDLLLYNSAGMLVDSSASTVDNVEHLYSTSLSPGIYDMEVVKRAGGVSASETYSMAFNLTGGAITLTVAGTLDLNGASQSVGGITGTGTVINSLPGTNAELQVVGSSQFNGVLGTSAGTVSLRKSVSGILKLTGANTYTGGTIVDGGTLLISNSSGSGTGTGSVTLTGGTLGGYGTISGAVIAGAGVHTIAPSATLGGSSTGRLTVGTLTTNSSTRLAFNLATPGASSVNDVITVSTSGGLTLGGGVIQVANTSTGLGSLGYYRIIQYSGTLNGSISGLGLPATVNNVAYVLDTQHDAGYIDIHRGLLGDANDDGMVTFADFVALSNHFGLSNQGWSQGDFNGDGTVSFADFVLLSNDFGGTIDSNLTAEVTPTEMQQMAEFDGTASSVPEPATVALLGIGMAAMLSRRWRMQK